MTAGRPGARGRRRAVIMTSPVPGTGEVPVPDALCEQAAALARRLGTEGEYARAGGGNVSAKSAGVLWIKPSGVALADLSATDLVPLGIEPLLTFLREGDGSIDANEDDGASADPVMRATAAARLDAPGGRRPSVEILFHALLPEPLVLHLHPVTINAVACGTQGPALAARLFGDTAVWVPYTDPGLPLARAIDAARQAHAARTGQAAPPVTILQNHGLIVGGESAAEIEERVHRLTEVVRVELAARSAGGAATAVAAATDAPARARALVDAIAPTLRGLLATGPALPVVVFDGTPRAATFPATDAGRAFVLGGPMTPDQIVYTGSWPLLFDTPGDPAADAVLSLLQDRLADHVAVHGAPPIVVAVPGLGIFAAGETWDQADTARDVYLDALRVGDGATALGGIRPLSDAERGFIESWEAEAYRRGVARSAAGSGRFAGKVAVVTGAAQGFGLGIAADLVAQGGHVILADLNVALATERARELERRHGRGRACAVAVNVTDEASVVDCIHQTVRTYGGLDVLISNAGVLRAGAVTSQPLAEFDLVTAVNYRGYFLAVRATAPVMARQHAAAPDRWFDVIEINSKSGLVGSSRNSAYAGSKFGGIGLTQSFALELVGDGIKVNAICPGNFFDGPLWSDPEDGLFVQYLRAGKVPGATTVEDVRRAYEAKVPMGRGCEPADVLEAIYYVVAQRYETGQAIPVTGGQVMLA